MLKKLYFTQKLDRNIKECDEIIEAVGPMIKIITAEKNKLMIQRLEIESELRKLGRDPKSVVEAMGLPYSPPVCSSGSTTTEEECETLIICSPDSSNIQSSDSAGEHAAGLYEEDLNLDSVSPLDLLRGSKVESKDKEEEEEEDDDDDDELEDFITALEENEGVYIEDEDKNNCDEKGEHHLENLLQNISVQDPKPKEE